MIYKIYLIKNLINSKKYVGITKFTLEERFIQHSRRGFLLTKAIKKYGKDKFSIELIEETGSSEEAYKLEQHYVKFHNSKAPYGYNLTDGGDGLYGVIISEEDRKRRSKVMKRLHKEKRTGMHEKKHTEETKQKMSAASKGKEKPWLVGTKRSEETKEKIRQANMRRVVSEETKRKISENHHDISGENNPMYGKKHSQETIEKIKEKAKNRPKKIWINNGIIEKQLTINDEIPEEFTRGRIKFKNKNKDI